ADQDVRQLHQLRVDAAGALVVEVRPRHRGAVDLRLHQDTLHGELHSADPGAWFDRSAAAPEAPVTAGISSQPRRIVSISRAVDILPASTIRHPLAASVTSAKVSGSTTAT